MYYFFLFTLAAFVALCLYIALAPPENWRVHDTCSLERLSKIRAGFVAALAATIIVIVETLA